jgi:hypothetical protein
MKLSRGFGAPTRPQASAALQPRPDVKMQVSLGSSPVGIVVRKSPLPVVSSGNRQQESQKTNSLQGRYIYDYNLVSANSIIIDKLQYDSKIKEETIQQLINFEIGKTKKTQTALERRKSNNKIEEYKHDLAALAANTVITKYLRLSKPLIDQYAKIGPRVKKINLVDGKEIHQEDLLITAERLSLIARFLEMAKEFVIVDVTREFSDTNYCICGAVLQNTYIDEEGIQTCEKCSTQHRMIVSPGSASIDGHNDHNKPAGKEEYDDWENLHKAFIRFQGKQTSKDFTNLFTILDLYFAKNPSLLRIIPHTELPRFDSRGRRAGTTLSIMITALRDTHNTIYYEDARLICKLYWSWTLQDLTQIEQRLRNDYNETQIIFNRLIHEQHEVIGNRTSALGTQYRLFKHLELIGVDCDREDFKTSIMPEVIETHDKIWKVMCERSINPSIYYIPTIA